MKVIVIFEYEGVDCNSEEADSIVENISESCETMGIGLDATSCWVDDVIIDIEVGEENET